MGPGSTLGGRYLLDTRVQRAPVFERWRGTDSTLQRDIVVLCFPAGDAAAAAALDAARRAAGVEDGRLVRVLDVGRDDTTAYVVEEPLDGARDLAGLVVDGPLPGEEARRLVGEAAAGLEAARRRGLHHGALDPSALLRLPDGRVKVRGLATTAALLGHEDLDAASASREDAVTLVALVHAALTGTWPAHHAALAVHGEGSGGSGGSGGSVGLLVPLPPAPTSVSGVLAPSEVVTDVPADLDTIARLTLAEGQGPLTPGDLAGQIAPWSRTPVEGPSGAAATRRTPAVGGTTGEPEATPATDAPVGGRARTGGRASAPRGATTVLGMSLGGRRPTGEADAQRAAGAVAGAAGTAAAAAATHTPPDPDTSTDTGTTVTSPVREAKVAKPPKAPKAPKPPKEPKQPRERAESPMRMTRDMRISDTLSESDEELESPVPLVNVPSRVERDRTGAVLAGFAAAVVLVAVLGIVGVSRIGSSNAPRAGATPTATATPTAKPTATASASASATASATGAPLQEVAIVQAQPWDPQGDGQEGNASAPRAFDGDPATAWRSQAYQSASFGGFQKQGIGLVLDLGQQTAVRQVAVTLDSAPDMSVYVASRESLDGATLIGSSSGKDGTQTFTPPGGTAQGQLVILWFTKLAPDGNGSFRAQVAEATVSK